MKKMFKNFFDFKQVRYWKKLPETEGMSKKENGKLHAILLSMFDAKFLFENVCWGIKCVKQDQADNSQINNDDGSKKKLYLKVDGIFLKMMKEVLSLSDENPTKTLGTYFKNILNNKVKRDKKLVVNNSN